MKKVIFALMCIAAMMSASTSLKAQEVTVVLMPGWNWISVPSTDTLDFATALGSFTPALGDNIQSQWGSATYLANGQWRGTISQFYPGYGYMYKSSRPMPVFLTFNVQQPTPQVVVTTSEPMLITAISAMGGGEVTVSDGTYILVKGLCWATHENPTTNDDFYQEAESGVGSFSISMTDLNIGTTYYVRAYAVTPNGTVYGDQKIFTTRDGIPTLMTAEVTNITGATATCGGNITNNGGLNVTARGVCWSTSPNPTIADSLTTDGSGMGSFSSSITELNVSTTYYVRAYATTPAGTGYGEERIFTTQNGIPTLTTMDVTNINGTTASCGGDITDNGGLSIIVKGVCWSTLPNPTVAGQHTNSGNETGSFTSCMTNLNVSTTYYVRAYATTAIGTTYGEEKTFTTLPNDGNHICVDLGLPSGTLWATCNVGANAPEGYGDHFAWGDTQPKDTYDWNTLQYCNGFYNLFTKYCTDSSYGYHGFTDGLTVLQPEDDAATANWGMNWRMPTKEEWQELYQNSTYVWTTQNGVKGRLFTTTNGNSIFLPAAGGHFVNGIGGMGSNGAYWSSSLDTNCSYEAWEFYFDSVSYVCRMYNSSRNTGYSVRPVYCGPAIPSYVIDATANPAEGGEVSGGGTYQAGAECTLTATANEGYTFTNWTENGNVVSADANYTFTINVNRTLVANFMTQSYSINVSASPSNGGSVSGGGSYNYGQSCTVHATANTGYTFTNWTINGSVVSTNANYTFTVNANKTLVANFEQSYPIGAINGLFSVSATRQVYFSKSNLQYQASTNTWKFADNQYDYIGSANSNISSFYSGWIDLFGWGTSGYHDNSDIYNTNYYPYSTSASLVNRTFNYFGYGPSINMPSNNLNGTSASYDWGVYNSINNGGNTANNWRILTQSEWNYLFNTRNTISGIRYAQARVNGINGILLLPDNWSSDIYSLNNTNNNGASFSNNEISDTDWTILENAGVVFLPASGNRYETSVSGVGSLGSYWSASYCTNNCVSASSLQFGNSYANTNYDNDRCRGLSVRLVRNAE